MNIGPFFKKYPVRRVLIGLSGGPDSMALFHLLVSMPKRLEIGVAHVDHGWRAESKNEALFVEKLAEQYGLPFFLHQIAGFKSGNLENESRNERMSFFQTICKREGYEALLLAHHADDQAETILKRCLEGAGITALQGIAERSEWNGMAILRPLLKNAKEDFLDYLKKNNIPYFIDPTNLDARFLRGRMRQEMVPFLNRCFGKNIRGPLCLLGDTAADINDYLCKQIEKAGISLIESDLGAYADLSVLTHSIEIKWFIQQIFKIKLSKDQLNRAASLILSRKANCWLENSVYLDRGYFFHFLERKKENFENFCKVPWKLKFEKFKRGDTELLGWKSVFSGRCRAILPLKNYVLGVADYKRMPSLDRLWNQRKVPALMRGLVPVLLDEQGLLAHEFLSGEKNVKKAFKGDAVTVSLYREY